MLLKYLSKFWRSLEIRFLNCIAELKLRWTKCCVLSVAGTDNVNANNDGNIIFASKDTKLYVAVVTLSVRDNEKLSMFIRINIKQKVIVKIRQMNLDIFLNQILLESIDYLFKFIEREMLLLKDLKLLKVLLTKQIYY